MSRKQRKKYASDGEPSPPSVAVELTGRELRTLTVAAHHYERSMGPARYLIRVLGNREVKGKLQFVVEESRWLERFTRAAQEDLQRARGDRVTVQLTPRALVAFWGRLLASLLTPRARRRLTADEIGVRDALSLKLQEAATRLFKDRPALLDEELATRRPVEAEWMRARLERGSDGPAL